LSGARSLRACFAAPGLVPANRLHAVATSVNIYRRRAKAGPKRKGGQAPRGAAVSNNGNVDMSDELAPQAIEAAAGAALKLDEFLPYRLNVCASIVSQALSRIYAEHYKIGVPEWRVLVTLGAYGMMTAKAIGLHSHMHKTKVSRAVALLERRKLLGRRTNRVDLREAFLSLTPAGREIYNDLAPMALDFARRLMDMVDTADRAALNRVLTILTERSAKIGAELANGRGSG
jgi:DNA-binding MarR family transcriptional regulator